MLPRFLRFDDGMQWLDLIFRIERRFGLRITPEEFGSLYEKNRTNDEWVAEAMFAVVRSRLSDSLGVIDEEVDGEALRPMFEQEVELATGLKMQDHSTSKSWKS